MEDYKVRQTGPEVQEALDQTTLNQQAIEDIQKVLPAEASAENPLADKQYVDGKVGAEATAREQAVTAEKTRAEGAESTLDGKIGANTQAIAAEKSRAEGAELTLDGKIGANTQAIANEKTRAEGAEGALQQLIQQVDASLINYYLKTETYSKAEVNTIIDNVKQFRYQVAATLPTASADTMGIIYLIPSANPKTQNIKEEYLTILDGSTYKWEHIGDTNIDLSGYSTTEQMNAAIATALANYYTKTQVDAMVQTINTAIGQKASQADLTAEVTRAQGAEQANADAIAQLQAVISDIETIAEGYVRVAGSSSPALSYKSYKYHEQGGFGRESVFSLFYPCLVGTPLTGSGTEGKVLHVLQKFGARTIDGVPMWLDIYSTPHKIDGSEGDVMIVNIEPYYRIMGQHEIEGTEYDVFLVSRSPFTWQGIEAEHVMKGGVSPDFCVSHQDTDGVTRMHSVYNPAWDGSYQAPDTVDGKYIYDYDAETGEITETYDENATLLGGAGGLPTTDLDLPTGEQRAMNNNPDITKTVPWMNQTAASVEDWYSVLLAEGGTFDAHNANKMGSGYSSNDPTAADDWEQSASGAKNGLRLVDKDGNWRVYNLASNMRYILGKGSAFYGGQIINSYRNPFHVLEAHRAVSFAIQNDVHELEWFAFEGNLYKWRSVDGFAGPEQGEMTCVLWKKLAGKLGATAKDPSDTSVSIAGNRIEFLISIALFHGITTQVSPSWWCSGLVFTQDENDVIEAYMEREQEALAITPTGGLPLTESWAFEAAYKHVGSFTKSSQAYQKNYSNDAIMLPKSNALKSGAGLHTYVGTANSFNGDNPSSGKSVRGFRRGAYARIATLSPLTLGAYYSPSGANASIGFGTCCRITE